jgi:hypothetical protein
MDRHQRGLAAPASRLLTVGEYHRMVSAAYKATGGAVSRVQVEVCVATVLQGLFLPCTVL